MCQVARPSELKIVCVFVFVCVFLIVLLVTSLHVRNSQAMSRSRHHQMPRCKEFRYGNAKCVLNI